MATLAPLLVSAGLIGWAAAMRSVTGTWLQPGAFFTLWWCFAGIIPLILAPNEPVGANAMVWLIAASIATSAGAVVGNIGLRTRLIDKLPAPTDRELKLFGWVLLAAIALGLLSNVMFALTVGVSLRDVLSFERLVVIANQMYFARYGDTAAARPPAISQAMLPFVYLAPAIGGVLFVLRREKKWKFLALCSFLPAVAVTVLQTTKAAMLFSLSLWLAGYFATRLRFGKLAVFTRAHVVTALLGVVSMFAVFFVVSLARLRSTDVSLANVVFIKLFSAAFGHMTAFSQWLADYTSSPFAPSLGKITFSGPLEMLGFGQRIPGLFESLVDLVAGDTSNVYTAFRPLISDFTIPGALVILFLLGLVGGVGFRLVAAGSWSGVLLLIVAYVTIFWTPVTWFWIYNSLTASVVALGILIWFIRLWRGAARARVKEQVVGTA
ncbi:MAG TPA: O-antigen polymerase [Gemmatimonadaceae bacterium]